MYIKGDYMFYMLEKMKDFWNTFNKASKMLIIIFVCIFIFAIINFIL